MSLSSVNDLVARAEACRRATENLIAKIDKVRALKASPSPHPSGSVPTAARKEIDEARWQAFAVRSLIIGLDDAAAELSVPDVASKLRQLRHNADLILGSFDKGALAPRPDLPFSITAMQEELDLLSGLASATVVGLERLVDILQRTPLDPPSVSHPPPAVPKPPTAPSHSAAPLKSTPAPLPATTGPAPRLPATLTFPRKLGHIRREDALDHLNLSALPRGFEYTSSAQNGILNCDESGCPHSVRIDGMKKTGLTARSLRDHNHDVPLRTSQRITKRSRLHPDHRAEIEAMPEWDPATATDMAKRYGYAFVDSHGLSILKRCYVDHAKKVVEQMGDREGASTVRGPAAPNASLPSTPGAGTGRLLPPRPLPPRKALQVTPEPEDTASMNVEPECLPVDSTGTVNSEPASARPKPAPVNSKATSGNATPSRNANSSPIATQPKTNASKPKPTDITSFPFLRKPANSKPNFKRSKPKSSLKTKLSDNSKPQPTDSKPKPRSIDSKTSLTPGRGLLKTNPIVVSSDSEDSDDSAPPRKRLATGRVRT